MSISAEIILLDPDQWEMLRDIRLRSLQINPEAFGGKYEIESTWEKERWREQFEKVDYLVALWDGRPIAVASVEVLDGDHGATCWIGGCWSDPEFRGKRIFSQLFNYLDEQALERGWGRQGLGVWSHNSSAIAAYRALGFEPAGEAMPSTSQPGKFYIHMVRNSPGYIHSETGS